MNQIAMQRLHSQQILQPRLERPEEVVAWLGALQGQDYAGAKWSIGLRLPGSTDADVEQAIDTHRIVRSWLMRGTLHLAAAEDLRWMLELVAPRLIKGLARRYKQLELDDETLMRSNDILENALAGGRQLNRRELLAILEAQGISTQGQRGVHMLQRASLDGLIYQGTAPSNIPTFLLLDELPDSARALSRDEALSKLALRYFTSRGPATEHDFASWAGLPLGDARAGLADAKSQLVEDVFDGTRYWRSDRMFTERSQPPLVYMPPGFDEYLLGYKDRSAVLDPAHTTRVCPGNNGIFYPTIVIDGQMVATWKRALKKDRVVITLSPFSTLTDGEVAAVAAAAPRYAQFVGKTHVEVEL